MNHKKELLRGLYVSLDRVCKLRSFGAAGLVGLSRAGLAWV